MDVEAEEINPPPVMVSKLAKLVAPATDKVEEAERGPAIERFAAMDDEAEEMKPPVMVKRLVKLEAPVMLMPPVVVRLVAMTVPVAKIPPAVVVPEIKALPWTANRAAGVPVPMPTNPPKVEVAIVEVAETNP